MHLLPPAPTRAEILAYLRAPDGWGPAMRAIAARHGLPTAELTPLPLGSNVVFAAGPTVVKLAPPAWAREVEAERLVLGAVDGRLAVPTPALVASGDLDGWPYVVIRRMPGRQAGEVWTRVPAAEQASLLEGLGAALAGLHRLDVPGLAALAPTFGEVLAVDAAARRARHVGYGLSPAWIEEIEARVAPLLPALAALPRVTMHADLTWDNVLLVEEGGRWRVSALLDFADAIVAPAIYDLAAPAFHWTTGRPDLWRAFLDGLGALAWPAGASRATSVLAACWVHRFVNLEETRMRRCPPPGPRTLPGLVAGLCPG